MIIDGSYSRAILSVVAQPNDAQSVYQGLVNRKAEGLFQVFDWQRPIDICCPVTRIT